MIPPPSSSLMAGSATLITDPSRKATKEARTAMTRTRRWSRVMESYNTLHALACSLHRPSYCGDHSLVGEQPEVPDDRELDVGRALQPAAAGYLRVELAVDRGDPGVQGQVG